jgi:hypothetical protein
MLLPDKYSNLDYIELTNAFLSEYYELVISADEDLTNQIINYLTLSIKSIDAPNSQLWKHLWLSYFAYVLNRSDCEYFADCIKKEKYLIPETSDDDFISFMLVLNIASQLLSKDMSILESPRLMDALFSIENLNEVYGQINAHKEKIIVLLDVFKSGFEMKNSFLKNSTYFNSLDIFIDGLVMLKMYNNIDFKSVLKCFESILTIHDDMAYCNFCKELYHMIEVK